MSRLLGLIIYIFCSTVCHADNGDSLKIKKTFNTVLINKDKLTLSKVKTTYKETFQNKIGDTLFYKISFTDIVGEEFILAKINGQSLIKPTWPVYTETGTIKKYQMLYDLSAKKDEKWKAEHIFNHLNCTIIFEGKIIDKRTNEEIYIFKISGDYATTHSDYVDKFYVSKEKGIIRLDFNKLYQGEKDERAISISDDFIKRSKIKEYLKTIE